MSNISYFQNAKNFVANPTFNTYISDSGDVLQYLHNHSATGALHDSDERYPPPLCHPGTGEAVVGRVEEWYGFKTPPKKKIMWVHAPAGYGKTAVAGTVSRKMESRPDLDFNPVGATFFFWRTSLERSSPVRFIITLAYQLTMSIPELAPHIEGAVKRTPVILKKALEVQLMKLIVEPFKSLGELVDDMPHRLIIVDGLDECINSDQESRVEKQYAEDQERVQLRVLDLIHTLVSHHLPLCFLILSRPEPWIKQHIESWRFQAVTETLDLYQVGDHMKDVEMFVRDELSRIAESLNLEPGNDERWPGAALLQQFLWRTGGHMLYAATVIRHIDDPYDDPRQRLQTLLSSQSHSTPHLEHSTPFSSLHELYRQILLSCPRAHRVTMFQVLEELLVSRYHFPPGTGVPRALRVLDPISGRAVGRGLKIIRPLHAVICVRESGSGDIQHTDTPFFYHSSFVEFLQNDPQLLPGITVNIQAGLGRLLTGCLKLLSSVTLNGQVDEDNIRFALRVWVPLWRFWKPSDDAEFSSYLNALLAVDLTACFVKDLTVQERGDGASVSQNISSLYDATNNLIVADKAPCVSSPFIDDAISHLRSSMEGALLHVLQPGFFESHSEHFLQHNPNGPHNEFIHSMARYMASIYQHRPPGFNSFIQALRRLRLHREELYEQFEQKVSRVFFGPIDSPLVGYMFNLVRQDSESAA